MAAALQMTWQPSLLPNHKRKPPLGLRNLGNSCYLNSVLQCLTYTPPLAQFCLKHQHSSSCDSATDRECPFCILEKRIARSLSIDQIQDAPLKINRCLKIFAEHFRQGRQEDAHEFLRYVIDACHNTCLRLKKLQRKKVGGGTAAAAGGGGSGDATVVKEIFGGTLQSQVKCLSCNAESNKVDEIMDISLDVFHSSSLKESLQKFFQPEILDGNNKYKCDSCKKLVVARKQMSILQAPNVLVIQLKRFEGILGGKIDKAIAFAEVLVLSSYMCKASQDTHPEYKLFGTIVHSGFSPDSGHYYAYIKDATGCWYCCNDSCVSVATLQDVLSEKVYIFFFSRTKQRPVSANGVRPYDSNGNDMFKSTKVVRVAKAVDSKQSVDHLSNKNSAIISEVDKVLHGPQRKPSGVGNSGSETCPPNGNLKIVVQKEEFSGSNGSVKSSVKFEKCEKNLPSVVDRNGVFKSKFFVASDGEKKPVIPSANGNGHIKNVNSQIPKVGPSKNDGSRNKVKAEKETILKTLQNGDVNHSTEISGSKRKVQVKDSCILFAKDAHSHAKLQELKANLAKEALSILQSCGWSDEVHSFMRSRKKLCVKETDNTASNVNESKCQLIADAKRAFISQIPESLKETLVAHLRSFSQDEHVGS